MKQWKYNSYEEDYRFFNYDFDHYNEEKQCQDA